MCPLLIDHDPTTHILLRLIKTILHRRERRVPIPQHKARLLRRGRRAQGHSRRSDPVIIYRHGCKGRTEHIRCKCAQNNHDGAQRSFCMSTFFPTLLRCFTPHQFAHLDEELIHIAPDNLLVFDEADVSKKIAELVEYTKAHGDPFLTVPYMRRYVVLF